MAGQGGPRTSQGRPGCAARDAGGSLCAPTWRSWDRVIISRCARVARILVFAASLAVSATAAAESTLRVRITWGGGEPHAWQGAIWVDGGAVADPRPLGIEADEPGSMWVEAGQLRVAPRGPRSFDGVDLDLDAPRDSRLHIALAATADADATETIIELAELVGEGHAESLDRSGNRLHVGRAPGDKLRVRLNRDSLIFLPNERFSLEVAPTLLGVATGTKLNLKAQLSKARTSEAIWSSDKPIVATAQATNPRSIPIEVPLPGEEGVYDLNLAAVQQGLPGRLGWKSPVASRSVQLVVMAAQDSSGDERSAEGFSEVFAIDPASQGWWDRVSNLPLIPGRYKGPLSNGRSERVSHALGQVVQLAPAEAGTDPGWQAHALPIERVGLPHILEIEYPSGVAQSLAISIVEPNAAGAVTPIGLDSGVYTSRDDGGPPTWATHRLVFWPKTDSPLALIANGGSERSAVYGTIRVLAGPERLPPAFTNESDEPRRLLAAYFNRPLFPENFSASEFRDPTTGHSLEDWVTFHEAGTRLVEYLEYAGYNGLMLSVLSDGSTIYPSRLLDPSPRYDSGAFFASGQDPLRKDSLELLFKLFDRADLKLVPALQFAAPLPAIEELLREGGPAAEGLEWVGAEGELWSERFVPRRGLAPYYNTLDPRVQDAMLAALDELVDRYGRHVSFGGAAIQLSADGYAQLPGAEWGFDANTVERFLRDAKVELEAANPAERARAILGEHRAAWIDWRARQLASLYERMKHRVAAVRPGARLYLPGVEMWDGPQLQRALRPALPRAASWQDAALALGIDERKYGRDSDMLLLRPYRLAPFDSLAGQGLSLELNQSAEADQAFGGENAAGGVFFHEPRERRLASFEAESPFRETHSLLVTHASPSQEENRRRFIHCLATCDAQAMFDGGWLVPLGQEAALVDLISVYRELPSTPLKTLADSTEPVTIRLGTDRSQTYVALINDSPWDVAVRMRVQAPAGCRLEGLGRRAVPKLERTEDGVWWTVNLRPYDLVAARFLSAGVKLAEPRCMVPDEVPVRLAAAIDDLGDRTATLLSRPPLAAPENAGFETAMGEEGEIAGWSVVGTGVSATADSSSPFEGGQSLRLIADDTSGTLLSEPFEPPRTGRLALSVWLRAGDPERAPPLRVALEYKHNGIPFYRFTAIGGGAGRPGLNGDWTEFEFPLKDLPTTGVGDLRVRFDLTGPGEVWIDDVRLSALAFTPEERIELQKLIGQATVRLETGQYGQCAALLDGYWPRFLLAHVPSQTESDGGAETAQANAEGQPQDPAPKTGLRNRLQRMNPFR